MASINQAIGFELWKHLLWADCTRRGKQQAFQRLGEYVLGVLYKSGLAPSFASIVDESDFKPETITVKSYDN